MKKLSVFILITLLLGTGCQEEKRQFPEVKSIESLNNTDFIATLENPIDRNKNSIYSASLLFAWDEIKQKLGPQIDINTKSNNLYLLNESNSHKGALKDEEYSASAEVQDGRIIAKAQFDKSLPFPEKLISYKDRLTFSGSKVASFGANGHHYFQHNIIDVLYYKNDNNFIVRLNPKDDEHQILLLMSSKTFDNIGEYYVELKTLVEKGKADRRDNKRWWRASFMEDDQLIIPKFSFNLAKDYNTIIGEEFSTVSGPYTIDQAWQRTAFILDEAGAEIESEALMDASESMEEDLPKPKKLIFDKPFSIFLARKDAPNPYFGMWVANSEIMILE